MQFFDEARFGRINRPVRAWAPQGIRPVVDCQTIREYLYVYGGACPHDGSFDAMIMPTMHTECFELYCQQISGRYPDQLVVIVLDGAGSHTATDLTLPDNVRVITLPPYSPELNPVEQVWDLIREADFANRTYNSLDDVERQLATRILTLEGDPDTIRSLTSRSWITSIDLM